MLEQLFSSRTRVKLLRLFINHPDAAYFTRELTRKIGGHLTAVRRELENLEDIGLVESEGTRTKKYYRVNRTFPLFLELKQLFFKAQIFHQRSGLQRIAQMNRVQLVLLTGYFVGQLNMLTDILIVGQPQRAKLKRLIAEVQKEVDHPINYTVLSKAEYAFRHDVTDRFLINILDKPHTILVDKLQLES